MCLENREISKAGARVDEADLFNELKKDKVSDKNAWRKALKKSI